MELYRVDYTLLGMVSSNCMKVLPISQSDEAEKKTQKVTLYQKKIYTLFLPFIFTLNVDYCWRSRRNCTNVSNSKREN